MRFVVIGLAAAAVLAIARYGDSARKRSACSFCGSRNTQDHTDCQYGNPGIDRTCHACGKTEFIENEPELAYA